MPMDTIMSLVRNSAFKSFASSVLYCVHVLGALRCSYASLRDQPRGTPIRSDSPRFGNALRAFLVACRRCEQSEPKYPWGKLRSVGTPHV